MANNRTYFTNLTSWTFHNSTHATNCSSLGAEPRKEAWVIPLVALCTVNVTAILIFEAYVLYKSCGGRRHLFLGQILLLGLLLSSLLGFAFVPPPNWFTCALTRAGAGVASALVFSTLLVKCVFLLSLHVGVYLSSAYQGLLLFFAVGVQLVIAVQWLVYRPAVGVVMDAASCAAQCSAAPADTLASLSYSLLLMVGVALLAVRARAVPENHGEALYIGAAVGLSIPLWLACVVAASVSREYLEPCLAFGLAVTASVVFLVMFLPKGRQLASMGRAGAFMDDGFSSVNQSVYTPSFLHLKPPIMPFVKQGTLVKPLTSTFPTHIDFSSSRKSTSKRNQICLPCIDHHEADRGYFVPPLQHASRLWRYSHHPATLQLPPPLHPSHEDIYLSSERYLFGPPGMKLYRSPLY